jgi:hypothetical protein
MLNEITLKAIEDFYEPSNSVVDKLGIVDRQIRELETIKSELKARLLVTGVGTYHGKHFTADVQEYDREQISAPLVRKLSNEDFVRSVTTVQHIKAVTVKPLGE